MGQFGQKMESVLEDLARTRDELRLQIHLGSAETKDEWEKLEKRWHELQRKREPLKEAVEQTGKELGAVVELLVAELKQGYQRIRKVVVK